MEDGPTVQERTGEVLWAPTPERQEASRLTAFARRLEAEHGVRFEDYDALWRWSVENLEEYWAAVWDFFDVAPGTTYDAVLADRSMPGAVWFPGARLNYAEHVLRRGEGRGGETALVAVAEDGTVAETTWAELIEQVGAVATALRSRGIGPGDRVVGYLPNIPQAVVAFLAAASVGAIWSACGPEIGLQSAIDRFAQLEPALLIAVDGYRFGGREHDRRELVDGLAAAMPSLREVVHVPVLGTREDGDGSRWADLLTEPGEAAPAQLPFDHPLWVVYSSGTTGLPKGLVHGHGGILLMALAQSGLQNDPQPGDRGMSYTSTTWIMWNSMVSGLLTGSTAVLYDGNPMYPSVDRLWQLAEEHRLTSLGVSPGYLQACEKAGLHPGRDHDLSALRSLGVTGSPLPAASFRWVYDELGPDFVLRVFSGGTDFAATLVGGSPWLPVHLGEMSGRALGCHVESWDDEGRPLVDEVGELVILSPMPSMPLKIWGDDDGQRYHDAYFDTYPGVWRHGDWLTVTSRGTCLIHGRSDSTLNRHGVRMGSSDIYQAVEALPEVAEALVLGVEQPDGGYWLPLFVRLAEGAVLDDELVDRIRSAVRTQASPRHVPDEVIEVPAIPHTTTGKKLEVPIKRIVQGVPVEKACNLGAVDDPAAVTWFADLAARRRAEA
ncbi:acetoacetate--CoA ligase [Blastococcus sp. TML/M2B]|uniref:acetoacetate--CoA ligase n=1 Tax=unclassified Blastococcus TaxID=2619396 RepID=UPI00190C107D|nr:MULTISPECIES: acetoacetate--CoA ligase [unclassified Blastococcus]MBN1094450.1 acetoacetate--CoA ligase [Blastococcus sp. TML/M2B]MBN1095409.1 acetoacetate--CoA ligase [Blastococcus sp. TML/C7B]